MRKEAEWLANIKKIRSRVMNESIQQWHVELEMSENGNTLYKIQNTKGIYNVSRKWNKIER